MIITFNGEQFFKVQAGDTIIALNPITPEKGEKVTRFGADIAISTVNINRYNGFETVTYGDKEPLCIDGAGSYESDGLMIDGFNTTKPDEDGKINTVYSFDFDDMKIAFLGSVVGKDMLPPDALEEITDSDIVFVSITDSDAHSFAVSLAPKIIIPMGYTDIKDEALIEFLKDAGAEKTEIMEKLTIKRRDIETLTGQVFVLGV